MFQIHTAFTAGRAATLCMVLELVKCHIAYQLLVTTGYKQGTTACKTNIKY
jgi:hypothetical protein